MLLFAKKLGIPTLDIAQAVQRLLHLARVLHHGPDWLWSLIQSQAGKQWRECVFLDLEFVAAVRHSKLADPADSGKGNGKGGKRSSLVSLLCGSVS